MSKLFSVLFFYFAFPHQTATTTPQSIKKKKKQQTAEGLNPCGN